MKKMITLETTLIRKQNQLFSEIDGEIVMLSIENGEYYSLDNIGAYIWNLLQESHSLREIVDQLLDEYEVTEEVCINDTKLLLEELVTKRIVNIIDE